MAPTDTRTASYADYQLWYCGLDGYLYIGQYIYDEDDDIMRRTIYCYGTDPRAAAEDFRRAVRGRKLHRYALIDWDFTADATSYMQDSVLHCCAVTRTRWPYKGRVDAVKYDFIDPATMPDSPMRDACLYLKSYEDLVGTL